MGANHITPQPEVLAYLSERRNGRAQLLGAAHTRFSESKLASFQVGTLVRLR